MSGGATSYSDEAVVVLLSLRKRFDLALHLRGNRSRCGVVDKPLAL